MNNTTYENAVREFSVADALPAERAAFIRKTYMHLALAILAFSAMTFYLVSSNAGLWIAQTMLSGPYAWLIVLGLFMGVSYIAQKWALSDTSRPQQYMGLIMFTVAEAIVFLPLLFMAAHYSGVDVIAKAGVVTLGLFLGLSATVLITRKDFSFLGPILAIGGFVALGFIVSGIVFGFSIGSFFAFAMVIFAGGSILYETSNMLHRYNTNQYVAASLGLFASVALLFYYILMIFMGRD
ncbi:MAG: Bax inhibitor-1 family protein [Acidobacteriota bacterium]|jgi:FtsH-binding integral membrane protein|nr:Bax inhibitor-1 family protein [Acidobacteriota bacterium]